MLNKFSRGVLRDPDPGAGGGGVTMEAVNAAINGAVTKMKAEVGTMVTTALKPFEGVGAQLTTVSETLTALQEKANEGKSGKGGKDDELPPAVALQIKTLTDGQKKLTESLAGETKRREEAEKAAKDTKLDSGLREALDQFTFVNPEAKNDAFSLLRSQVEFGEDGSLVAGGLPMADFVKSFVPEKKGHLLATKQVGGAGASAGSPGSGKGFQMESIKNGMTPADTQAAAGAILAALKTP